MEFGIPQYSRDMDRLQTVQQICTKDRGLVKMHTRRNEDI